jgi:hypothetical protein
MGEGAAKKEVKEVKVVDVLFIQEGNRIFKPVKLLLELRSKVERRKVEGRKQFKAYYRYIKMS